MTSSRIAAAISFLVTPWNDLFHKSQSDDRTLDHVEYTIQGDRSRLPFTRNKVAGPRGIPSRSEQVSRLVHSSNIENPYDILVIGGGATGAGIALDAVTRTSSTHPSLRVACIERGDFASETSSRSTKLIWAGIRYLATATSSFLSRQLLTNPIQTLDKFYSEIQMVIHCHRERQYMTTKQQHLTNWVPILIPFTSWYLQPPPFNHGFFSFFPIFAPLALKIYDGMSGFTCPSSFVLTPNKAIQTFPLLRHSSDEGLKYCAVFYEAQHNDARTNLAIAMTAADYGAHIANYVEMVDVIRGEDSNKTKVIGILAVDRMTHQKFPIYAKHIVFAGGPFTDHLRLMEYSTKEPSDTTQHEVNMKAAVKSAAGTHIVLPDYYCPRNMGLLDYNTSDGRFLFILPWENHTLIGTTDVKIPARSSPKPQEEEIQWILKECGKYLTKDLVIRRSDVLSGWTGYRPLVVDPHLPPGAPISRDHVISINPDTGIIFIAGGKWTTWRQMAQDVVDKIVGESGPACKTLDITLYGGNGWSPNLALTLLQKYDGMTTDTATNIAKTYGGRSFEVCDLIQQTESSGDKKYLTRRSPKYRNEKASLLVSNFPYIDAEVRFACREYACTIEDVLSRRTRLAFLNKEAALSAIPTVADIMSEELGWSETMKKEQINNARKIISDYAGRTP